MKTERAPLPPQQLTFEGRHYCYCGHFLVVAGPYETKINVNNDIICGDSDTEFCSDMIGS